MSMIIYNKMIIVRIFIISLMIIYVNNQAIKYWRRSFQGSFKMGSSNIKMECRCQEVKKREAQDNVKTCTDIESYDIKQITRSGPGYPPVVMSRLLGRPDNFRQVAIDATSFSCIDGREPVSDTSLRTPGGDISEFIYALSWYVRDNSLSPERLDSIFYGFLANSNKREFYYHTDAAAVMKIRKVLAANFGYSPQMEINLSGPPKTMQPFILAELMRPENQGCIHLKLMMFFPARYGVELFVIQHLIQSFFSLLWDRDRMYTVTSKSGKLKKVNIAKKLKLVISQGVHEEGAWIDSEDSSECHDEGIASVFPPQHDYPQPGQFKKPPPKVGIYPKQRQVFVNHPQAISVYRREIARWFQFRFKQNEDDFLYGTNQIGDRAIQTTKEFLTNDLRQYKVTTK